VFHIFHNKEGMNRHKITVFIERCNLFLKLVCSDDLQGPALSASRNMVIL
jgi:hypothetical protein